MTNQQHVVISGGASGIGLATAKRLASQGIRVSLLDMNPNTLNEVAALPGEGHQGVILSVTDHEKVELEIRRLADIEPITGLVVSAGIVSQTQLIDISGEEFSKVINVNVVGVHNVVAAVARTMVRDSVHGSIVVLGSVAAFNGGGLMGRGAYSTSKAALLGMVRSYARELAAHTIRINTVAPGATETPMTASLTPDNRDRILSQMLIGRFLETDEIVSAIEYLLGSDSSSFTGQTLHANGGSYFG